MLERFELKRWNRGLISTYVTILSILLVSYFFMTAFRSSGYDPELYKKAYLYLTVFSLILASSLLAMWDLGEEEPGKKLQAFSGPVCFAISSVPLVLMTFSIGQLHGINLLLPLWIQILWGMVIISIKSLLGTFRLPDKWKNYLLLLLADFVLGISLIYLFLYTQYAELVLTTVYDKDIPPIFFLNPLLTLTGLTYVQTGGTTQMNMDPVIIFSMFWGSIVLLCNLFSYQYWKRAGGRSYEKI